MEETIKEFLVGLGFSVDDQSLSKFNKSIKDAAIRVTALYASIKVAAAGIFYGISKISEGFEQMGYEYRLIAPAINKTIVLRNELLKAYKAAGVNITSTIKESIKFNLALKKTEFAFKAIAGSVAAKFFPMLTKQMDLFRSKIYANMPKIQAGLEKFVKFIFKAFEATVQLGTRIWQILQRVYDFFYQLHQQTSGWSTVIFAVIAAWKLLNLAFLATPLGMIISGIIALIALWDDFKVWKEGGKSLFDWTTFVPVIESVTKVITGLRDSFDALLQVLFNVIEAFKKLFSGDFSGFFSYMKEGALALIDLFKKVFENLQNIFGVAKSVGSWAGGLLNGFFSGKSAQNVSSVASPTPALGSGVLNNNQTSMNLQQQTNINISGSADATSVGKSVANEQGRVNYDLTRNFTGAAVK